MHRAEPVDVRGVFSHVRYLLAAIFLLLAAACGPAPTPSATPVATPFPTPTAPPAATPSALSVPPLPAGLSGIPAEGVPTAEVSPVTPSDELEVGQERGFVLGHCGLGSPVDIDASLWNPVGGHNGAGGPLNELQQGELINATSTVVLLTSEDVIEMRTPSGAVIVLHRHDGPRDYYLCD